MYFGPVDMVLVKHMQGSRLLVGLTRQFYVGKKEPRLMQPEDASWPVRNRNFGHYCPRVSAPDPTPGTRIREKRETQGRCDVVRG